MLASTSVRGSKKIKNPIEKPARTHAAFSQMVDACPHIEGLGSGYMVALRMLTPEAIRKLMLEC